MSDDNILTFAHCLRRHLIAGRITADAAERVVDEIAVIWGLSYAELGELRRVLLGIRTSSPVGLGDVTKLANKPQEIAHANE